MNVSKYPEFSRLFYFIQCVFIRCKCAFTASLYGSIRRIPAATAAFRNDFEMPDFSRYFYMDSTTSSMLS
jgi:hypothetical protein